MPKKRSSTTRKKSGSSKRPARGNAIPDSSVGMPDDHAAQSAGAAGSAIDVVALERDLTVRRRLAEQERLRRISEYAKAVDDFVVTADADLFRRGKKRKKVKPPVRILAEGDSWFDFPFGGKGPLKKGDVIAQLAALIPFPILNIAVRGEEIRQMLGVHQRTRLQNLLRNNEHDFNALLFSGGGNDLVGDQLCLWLRSKQSASGDPAHGIDEPAIAHGLGVVRTGYEQLLDLRDSIVRETPGRRIAVFLHAYDHAIPTGKGVCGYGPWLKPSLDFHGWTERKQGKVIIRSVLSRLAAMLRDLAARRSDVYFVESHGTVGAREWNDELHPNGTGFKKVAIKFAGRLKEAFPEDIP